MAAPGPSGHHDLGLPANHLARRRVLVLQRIKDNSGRHGRIGSGLRQPFGYLRRRFDLIGIAGVDLGVARLQFVPCSPAAVPDGRCDRAGSISKTLMLNGASSARSAELRV